jgi:protein phosphatase methylesterase 1
MDAWGGGQHVTLPSGPVWVTWSRSSRGAGRPTLVLLHGAGQSSLSWSTTVAALRCEADVVAYDAHAHGLSAGNATCEALSKEALVGDCEALLALLRAGTLPGGVGAGREVVLAGHSMGGAVATWVAQRVAVRGLFVMDVVEGPALAGLAQTRAMLEARPVGFASTEAAVEWSLASGALHHRPSAQCSLPGQLRAASPAERAATGHALRWRTDVVACFAAWPGWFQGLSQAFCDLPLHNKVLLLAGADTMDKTLIVGQMQGRFKLIVLHELCVGHFVHEDAPQRTAAALALCLQRAAADPLAPLAAKGAAGAPR